MKTEFINHNKVTRMFNKLQTNKQTLSTTLGITEQRNDK